MSQGHAAMLEWNSSWRHHHLPMWAKKAIRANAIKKGTWRPSSGFGYTPHESFLTDDLFDHYGSVKKEGVFILVAQPYGNHDDLAKSFAEELGWVLKISNPAPWNSGTWLYEFYPKPELKKLKESLVSR